MEAESKRLTDLRDYLRKKLENALDYVHVNGNMDHHLPGNLNMSFIYVEGESLLMGINDIAVSSGFAASEPGALGRRADGTVGRHEGPVEDGRDRQRDNQPAPAAAN